METKPETALSIKECVQNGANMCYGMSWGTTGMGPRCPSPGANNLLQQGTLPFSADLTDTCGKHQHRFHHGLNFPLIFTDWSQQDLWEANPDVREGFWGPSSRKKREQQPPPANQHTLVSAASSWSSPLGRFIPRSIFEGKALRGVCCFAWRLFISKSSWFLGLKTALEGGHALTALAPAFLPAARPHRGNGLLPILGTARTGPQLHHPDMSKSKMHMPLKSQLGF